MERLTYTNKSNGISVPRKLVYDINMDRTNFAYLEEIVKKLAYYEDLDESGKLFILPNIVYQIMKKSCSECRYGMDDCRGLTCDREIVSVEFETRMLKDINIVFFLTREEADLKLKEIE